MVTFLQGIGVEEQGDRPVIDRGHLHIGAEYAVFYVESPLFALGQELLVQRDGQIRFCGVREAGAAGFQVGVEGELTQASPDSCFFLEGGCFMWLPMTSFTSEMVTKADWSARWMMRRMAGSSMRVTTQ